MTIPHPRELLLQRERHWLVEANDRALDWIARHVLASILMFDIALIVPLVTVPAPDSVKITLALFSGSWIQWWALPALQRTGNKAEAMREAKADADHQALTHIAGQLTEVLNRLPPHA